MYIIIPTHGHYEIRDGPTFIQSADTYREAWHELASLITISFIRMLPGKRNSPKKKSDSSKSTVL